MDPKQIAVITRFVKVTACEVGALVLAALLAFITKNDLGINATYLSIFVAVATPLFVAAQKWLTWQETQV